MYRQRSLPSGYSSPVVENRDAVISVRIYAIMLFQTFYIKGSLSRSFPQCIRISSGQNKSTLRISKHLVFMQFYVLNRLRFGENHQFLNDVHLVSNVDGFVNSAVI